MEGIVTDIALINGSPKARKSASGAILQSLKPYLPQGARIREFSFRNASPSKEMLADAAACDVLVFAAPLYVDGLPSHVVAALLALEEILRSAPPKERTIYAIVNCGFYEGHQAGVALRMFRNWCMGSNASWGQGIGVGAGGILSELEAVPMGRGPKKNLGEALQALAENIALRGQAELVFLTANFPRFLYRTAAEFGWRKQAKANGLHTRDLFAQPGGKNPT